MIKNIHNCYKMSWLKMNDQTEICRKVHPLETKILTALIFFKCLANIFHQFGMDLS